MTHFCDNLSSDSRVLFFRNSLMEITLIFSLTSCDKVEMELNSSGSMIAVVLTISAVCNKKDTL